MAESEMVPLQGGMTPAAVQLAPIIITKKTKMKPKATASITSIGTTRTSTEYPTKRVDNFRRIGFASLGILILALLVIDGRWFAAEEKEEEAAAYNYIMNGTTTTTTATGTAAVIPEIIIPTDISATKSNETETTTRTTTILATNNQTQIATNKKLPELSALITFGHVTKRGRNKVNDTSKVLQNVEFLLDFAVVGFGKCGTTTLLKWLQQRNNGTYTTAKNNDNTNINSSTVIGPYVLAPDFEPAWLNTKQPTRLVRKMYNYALEEEWSRFQGHLKPTEKVYKAFKNPKDIRLTNAREMLTTYWPNTPLIVTVRHPVHWMVSIHNFFRIEQRNYNDFPADRMIGKGGRDSKGNTRYFVSSAKGEFHTMLAELGKTPMIANTPEWDLLKPWLTTTSLRIMKTPLPNPIFFMEMNQMNDSNQTRTQQLSNDLETFTGLPKNHLPPAPLHVRPGGAAAKTPSWAGKHKTNIPFSNIHNKLHHTQGQQNINVTIDPKVLKMDICAAEYAIVLNEMMAIAISASQWLQEYFIVSPSVSVSNPKHLKELLEGWKINPCDSPAQRRYMLEL